mmetsp:Transcript_44776/g.143426  ORF Transcript_44776/g.143426 Transcript_44776/m.143426 type:complete len:380 (+) Transcript_44776:76-1215(+)
MASAGANSTRRLSQPPASAPGLTDLSEEAAISPNAASVSAAGAAPDTPGGERRESTDNSGLGVRGSPAPIVSRCGDDQHVVARIKILSHPGHYMNHEASHLIDPKSVEYWASLPGHVRDQAFVFELDQAHVLARVEWKDRGDGMGAARLCLEAHSGDTWQKLSTWDATQTSAWQEHTMSMSLRSHQWRLTFVCNHGDDNHLVVQGVRFIVKLPPASPAHNVMHSQRITRKLWCDRLFTDVEILCGTQRFHAHRAVLAAASPVFAAMLATDMKESQEQVIRISDADEQAVLDTLEYIYTGTVGENAGCGMVVLGHKYDIAGLVEYAAPVALGNLTAENCVQEVRTLRQHAEDKQLGPVFEALLNKVHENPHLFRSVLLGI